MTVGDLGPEAAGSVLERAGREGPAGFGPRDELLRYGWASAVLECHPPLLLAWATSPDRAVRRAIMRSPELDPVAAEALVGARRSGLHTLGANPVAPRELLIRNPSARRRWERVTAALGSAGLDGAARRPNREVLLATGSATVDLVVARAAGLESATARRLATRADPPPDPWVLAHLGSRFGRAVWASVDDAMPRDRRRAARALVERLQVGGRT